MTICCQNLPLGALSSRSALSVLVGELFKKFGLFFEHRCTLPQFVVLCHKGFEVPLLLRPNTPCTLTVNSKVRDFDVRDVLISVKKS